jgi:hypothetical protein
MAFDAGKKGEENSDVDFIPVGETREFSVAVDSAPGESDRTVKIGNQYKIILLTVLSFVIVVLLYRIFILDDGKSFPLIAPGAYYGQIVGLRSEGDRQSFYIERDDAQNLLHVVILAAGWMPHRFPLAADEDMPLAPLVLRSGDTRLHLMGKKDANGSYSGEVYNLHSNRKGFWKIAALAPGVFRGGESDIKFWLSLRIELAGVESSVHRLREALPQQAAEIERLTAFVVEGKELKARAAQKYGEAEAELKAAQRELAEKQKNTRTLAAQLEVSERLTAAGRLVGLSRESLERENRWLESMLRVTPHAGKALSSAMPDEEHGVPAVEAHGAEVKGGIDALRDDY